MINFNYLIVILNGETVFPSIPVNAHMNMAGSTIVNLKLNCSHLNWKVKINVSSIDFFFHILKHCYNEAKNKRDQPPRIK